MFYGLVAVLALALASPGTTLGGTEPTTTRVVPRSARLPDIVPEVQAFPGTWFPIVRVGALGAPFEVWATRMPEGAIALRQVVRAQARGGPSKTIPISEVAHGFPTGLPGFARIELRQGARLIESETIPVCVDTGGSAAVRIDEVSPRTPPTDTYPYACGHVFARSVVWGIDSGWAVDVPWAPPSLAAGAYALTVTVDPQHLFADRTRADNTTVYRFRVPASQAAGSHEQAVERTPQVSRGDGAIARADATSGNTARPRPGLPNLIALPADGITLRNTGGGANILEFGAGVYNAGPGELRIDGEGHTPGSTRMPAYQRILRGGHWTSRRIGSLEYDALHGHDHWHLERFASYSLLHRGHTVRTSTKVGFCLDATDPVDLSIRGAVWSPPSFDGPGAVAGCGGADWTSVRMALDAGWADEYTQLVAGQAFNVTNLPNGKYSLEILANPTRRLFESRYSDNESRRALVLSGKGSTRRVRLLPT